MKRILKSELDKFYTKQEIAIDLIKKITISDFDVFIDPCCGDGAFYSNVEHTNKIGIDILPHIDNVIKHDFLTWDYSDLKDKKVITISNPPFGKQGSLAIKFIKRCSNFCDTIAFILPLSFVKDSMKNRIPEYFHLEYEEILPENSFLLDEENYDVKCVFQIWKKKPHKREKIKPVQAIGFTYTRDKTLADISVRRVGIYAGKAFLDTDKSEQSHYFLILDDKSKINLFIEELNNKTWIDYTVGPRSISKPELNIFLNKI